MKNEVKFEIIVNTRNYPLSENEIEEIKQKLNALFDEYSLKMVKFKFYK